MGGGRGLVPEKCATPRKDKGIDIASGNGSTAMGDPRKR